MKKIYVFLMIVVGLYSLNIGAQSSTHFDLRKATLEGVNSGSSTLYFNGQAFLYKPEKSDSIYRGAEKLMSIDITDLEPGKEYYFEILFEEIKSGTEYHDKPIAVIFVANDKPPE